MKQGDFWCMRSGVKSSKFAPDSSMALPPLRKERNIINEP
ncbi:MAG: hypothetical protein ACI8RD_012234 [Bacillariaceae sp.]|jgi:hypothetical protein